MPFSHAYGTQPWDRPSSWNEHIMPLDGTPRSLPLVIFTPPGRVDLCRQTGQISPTDAGITLGAAGDDLHRLLLADIELADLQMVGIRVIDNLEDLAGHNVVDLRARGSKPHRPWSRT